ncbi:YdcF family protein [Roseibium sp.]|uniref:YdcF family protein n=1 Tax=Roseibium sp. TaxID=1936156 RepID=UPI003A977642
MNVFFILSKVAFFFLQPSNALVFGAAVGCLLLFTRWRGAGRWMVLSCVGLIALAGLGPAANWLILPLEERFQRPAEIADIDGIIVLGGALDTIVMGARGEPALTTAAERLAVVPGLARRLPGVPIVHTGGHGLLVPGQTTEADGAAALFRDFAIEPGRITLEAKSRNTVENAVYTRQLLEPQPGQRWLLITSAYHMPRAVGVFRQAGWDGIVAYPVDWRTRGWSDAGLGFSGVSQGLRRFDIAAREWMGLLAYWMTGKTSSLFPARS